MLNALKHVTLLTGLAMLTSCSNYNYNDFINYKGDLSHGTELYPEGYDNSGSYSDSPTKPVVVPESYHVSADHGPVQAKDADQQWAQSQNPSNYTIVIAEDKSPSTVANALMNTPKQEHTAQLKLDRGQSSNYVGVYGSYPNQEAAQKAMDTLPANLKQKARIQTWVGLQ